MTTSSSKTVHGMSEDLKDRWVAALRSGKYEQGTGQLRLGGTFCCLGVLCDVVDPGRWVGNDWEDERGDRSDFLPPSEVMSVDLANHLMHENLYLQTLNDAEHYSFEQIADVIEERWNAAE